jgi:hypothetical protein
MGCGIWDRIVLCQGFHILHLRSNISRQKVRCYLCLDYAPIVVSKSREGLYSGCWMLDSGCWMLDTGCWKGQAVYYAGEARQARKALRLCSGQARKDIRPGNAIAFLAFLTPNAMRYALCPGGQTSAFAGLKRGQPGSPIS